MSAHDLLAQDAEARRAARTVFDRPLVLEAGAGTGKTSALVARVLAWSLGPGWERSAASIGDGAEPSSDEIAARTLERVVAITFTEAAAAEMAERVGVALGEVLRGESPKGLPLDEIAAPPGERAARARALLGALDHLVVRTIHAWCRRTLARHPLEAGLAPVFEVDSDGEARARAAREAMENGLRGLCADPETRASLVAIANAGFGVAEIEEQVLALLEASVPADVLDEPLLTADDARRVSAAVRDAALEVRSVIGARFLALPKNSRHPRQAVAELDELLGGGMPPHADPLVDLARIRAWIHGAESLRTRLGDWTKGEAQTGERKVLDQSVFALLDAAAVLGPALARALALDPLLLEHGRRIVAPLLRDATERLRASGFISFDALLRRTRTLLETHPDVAQDVRSGIDQLLVDEFQDTDHVQCAIVRCLALSGPEASRPALFLVGDPKQSIYGWRQADLAAYDAFVTGVVDAGGLVARLSRNFRSVPEILDDVERVIRPVMIEERGVQPRFEPLIPHHASRGDGPAVEYWVSWSREERAATAARDAARLEARAIAEDACHQRAQHGTPWREMAILLRGMSDVDLYLDALRAQGVPYQVARDRAYFRRREIVDAAALVRAIVDPGDDLALVAWLRSPAVGVPDAAWVPLWTRRFPEHAERGDDASLRRAHAIVDEAKVAVAALEAEIPALARVRGWDLALHGALDDLAALRASFRSDPPDVFVEMLRTRTQLEIAAARRFLGAFRLANLERFWLELIEALDADRADPQALLRRLRRAVAEAEEAEEARPDAFAEDAIQVMTMHGAKGLDFSVVYLPQLHKQPRSNDARVPIREAAGTAGVLTISLFGAMTLAALEERERVARVAEAERVRLLYVAMTRAKHRLVLCGNFASSRRHGSMAQILERREPPLDDLETLAASCESAGTDGEVAGPIRIRFPGVLFSADLDAGARGRPAVTTDASALLAVARDLEAKQAAAREHAARRFAGAVSERAHERLHEIFAQTDDGAAHDGAARLRQDVAMAVGSTVHRIMEIVPLDGDVRAALEGTDVASAIPDDVDAAIRLEVETRARAIVAAFASGPLADRFAAIAPRIRAREFPVLMAPADAGSSAVGYVSGTIDLVYEDEDGRLVVADFKTDDVVDDALTARADAYALQLVPYARALESAFALPARPRAELWFVVRDEIREVRSP